MPQTTTRGRTFPPEPLTTAEVHRLLAAASRRSSSGVRMRALIAVLYGSGLRIAEALALYPRDLDLDAGRLRVRRGKGSKDRLVGLDPYAAGLVQAWLDRRRDLGLTTRQPVFATYSRDQAGTPVAQVYVRNALRRLAARAGVEKRVHPHGFRHSFAFDLAERRVPLHHVQRQLGHGSLAQTERYISHLAPLDVVEEMRARDWSS